jgi:uncharacterized membrane protein YdjX (TVP38/TMEM64 family)
MHGKRTPPPQRIAAAAFLLVSLPVLWYAWHKGYFTFDNLVAHRDALVRLARDHRAFAAAAYTAAVVSTAFFVPGAIVMTLAGGLLFGVLQGVILFNAGSVIGAAAAFLLARYAFGETLQRRYGSQLEGLNNELERHGYSYMIALRIVPVMPFFLMNYLAGVTRVRARTFVWTTALGMLPGSVVYCYAGSQRGRIESPGDILSPGVAAALALLALFSLLPPLRHWGGRLFRRK